MEDTMKKKLSILILIFVVIISTNALATHPLGMPNIVFCTSFYNKVNHKMPMLYKDFIKLTDGEGMPVSETRRHWDGKKNSYLTIDVVHNGVWVKAGIVTCPNGDEKEF
jgi:hypothetical protein